MLLEDGDSVPLQPKLYNYNSKEEFHFNQNSTTTTQKRSPSYYFNLAANLGIFKQLSLIPKCKIKW